MAFDRIGDRESDRAVLWIVIEDFDMGVLRLDVAASNTIQREQA